MREDRRGRHNPTKSFEDYDLENELHRVLELDLGRRRLAGEVLVRARGKKGKPTHPIESDNVVITLLGVEFDGEPTRITSRVRKFSTQSDSRETYKDGCLDAFSAQEIGLLRLNMRHHRRDGLLEA